MKIYEDISSLLWPLRKIVKKRALIKGTTLFAFRALLAASEGIKNIQNVLEDFNSNSRTCMDDEETK
ncbi:CLUMA_CG017259, isoform A [Clunio marinus]|uniref:CLUMA_CG017259, isoform A n=1 Tax=Clunio marinus TaxID=568069 RepID=A0A1J1IX67_9DIPT|nr:CLUMA_CG017259, isoform A [Clunio marinus]